ncbi:Aldehyde dehydrogenase [Blyttiomyces sp. JEL0837]|nr:Aldehyde dehydrogenase [Blyttiomyces sp. JEL0837]
MTTGVIDYSEAIGSLRSAFNTHKTRSKEWRVQQLTSLLKFMQDHETAIGEAVLNDLRKPLDSTYDSETLLCKNEIIEALDNLDEWMSPEQIPASSKPFYFKMIPFSDQCEIRNEPLGVVLVIGAFNFPFMLVMVPVINAIAAGNCVVIKPSELTPHTGNLLATYLPKVLDPSTVRVVTGGIPETTALLTQKFDLIFYTGSNRVGKIIMKAAAEQVTRVVLELGGKCPVIVNGDGDLDVVAKRILWAKLANGGQACLSPDYVLVPKQHAEKLYKSFQNAYKQFFGETPHTSKNTNLVPIINKQHYNRLTRMIDSQLELSHTKNLVGGLNRDEDDLFIEPVVLGGVKTGDPVMEEEVFGPVLGIVEADGVDEALEIVHEREHPLGLYIFSEDDKVVERILNETNSGCSIVNDLLMNMFVPALPFGGVQGSGMGNYHGHNGFKTFTHQRAIMKRSLGFDFLNAPKYPVPPSPSSSKKIEQKGGIRVSDIVLGRRPSSQTWLFVWRVWRNWRGFFVGVFVGALVFKGWLNLVNAM